MGHLIDVDALAAEIGSDRPVRLLDVRWRLDIPEGRPAYLAAHIPAAVYVDLESELSRRGDPAEGRYPLPHLPDLEQSARRWGLDEGDLVVAYDDNDGVAAARLWWLLRLRGVDVRVLDGGVRAWIAAGLPIERGDHRPVPGTVVLRDVDPGVASIDDAARSPQDGYLVDVRSPEHYRGLTAGPDPAAGHIPGALNIPTVAHIAADGRLRPAAEIRETVVEAGVDPAATITLYCGAGIASAHSALALAHAGIPVRIFPGSWSQWSHARERPVAVGRTPADHLSGW